MFSIKLQFSSGRETNTLFSGCMSLDLCRRHNFPEVPCIRINDFDGETAVDEAFARKHFNIQSLSEVRFLSVLDLKEKELVYEKSGERKPYFKIVLTPERMIELWLGPPKPPAIEEGLLSQNS